VTRLGYMEHPKREQAGRQLPGQKDL